MSKDCDQSESGKRRRRVVPRQQVNQHTNRSTNILNQTCRANTNYKSGLLSLHGHNNKSIISSRHNDEGSTFRKVYLLPSLTGKSPKAVTLEEAVNRVDYLDTIQTRIHREQQLLHTEYFQIKLVSEILPQVQALKSKLSTSTANTNPASLRKTLSTLNKRQITISKEHLARSVERNTHLTKLDPALLQPDELDFVEKKLQKLNRFLEQDRRSSINQ